MASKPILGKEESVEFLFEISKIVKLFYEIPVILVTKKDYALNVFNTLSDLRLVMRSDSKEKLMDIILEFHLQWLHAVNDIENFTKLIKDLTRDEIPQAISYTIDAMQNRLKTYEQYMTVNREFLSNETQANIVSDVEIVEEMHEDVVRTLMERMKCFRNYDAQYEFTLKVNDAVEQIFHWLDKMYDSLAMLLSNYVNVNVPHLSGDLPKTLQQIVGDMQNSKSVSSQKLLEEFRKQDKELNTMIRSTTAHGLEICKVENKISVLDDRIMRLQNEPISAALMALKHKKEYLEKRLSSLENLKTTLKEIDEATDDQLKSQLGEDEQCICEDFYQLRIFNHQLPIEERERLVTELCYLWDMAVFGDRSHKSIISILSVTDMKEEFTDELGTYHVDEYSRKIYKLPDDEVRYQPNENNELVPLTDDEHIYFYDECGRYFIDQNTRQRVYRALGTSSEYMLSSAGVLLKTKEIRHGVTFYYDNYGRYYINREGKNIYRDADTLSEYENDGFGNLVRIRSHSDIFTLCPEDENVTQDFLYIKQSVGKALRVCIAQVILYQPSDPVKFLSACLLKYRENIELQDKRAREKEELAYERELLLAEERARLEAIAKDAALFDQGASEASYDSNLRNYRTMQIESEVASNVSTTK
ncbi:uncharacterized protein [Battus philenor]|uniref:uncharacterized protein n=1 Tax=Battus philenor TaxID=42288 RepID=UPI0035CF4B35